MGSVYRVLRRSMAGALSSCQSWNVPCCLRNCLMTTEDHVQSAMAKSSNEGLAGGGLLPSLGLAVPCADGCRYEKDQEPTVAVKPHCRLSHHTGIEEGPDG